MISSIISRLVILVFGTLYPAYASYKAVKTKNVKEYVKWMMYWIVFALFTCTETITDIFLSWFPFYYEIKIILVIWLLSPATKGSSILYRKFVHPMLSSREQEIDEYISKAKEQSYRQVLDLGQKGVTVLMQTAIKGGGGIVNQLKKSYSLSDLSDPTNDANDETDDVIVTDPRLVRRRKPGRSPHRSSSASSASVYFSEVDVGVTGVVGGGRVTEVRSIEDISSGYSSGEGLYAQNPLKLQARDSIASQRTSSLTRARSTRVTRSNVPKKTSGASDDSDENEVFDTNIIFLNDKMKKIDKLPDKHESSSSETEFFDIPESKGFQLHGKIFDNKEKTSSSNSNSDCNITSYRNEKIDNNHLKFSKDSSSTSVISHSPTVLGYGDHSEDNKVTACKSDSSSPLSFNLTKLSTALSSLYPVYVASTSNVDNTKTVVPCDNLATALAESNKAVSELKTISPESANLESNYQKPEIQKIIQNVVPNAAMGMCDNTKVTTSQKNEDQPILTKKISGLKAEFLTERSTGADNSNIPSKSIKVQNDCDNLALKSEARGGKYRKKIAPLPPLPPRSENIDALLPPRPPRSENITANPIKATLVLQPGIVRNLSRSAESLDKQIFLNYSPKVRRKSRNPSPSSRSSRSGDSNGSSKMEQALNKMLRLPKKVAQLNIPGKVKEKRNSWGEFFNSKKLEDGKIQSKSVTDLDKTIEPENMQEVVKPIQRTGSQISIKSLSDSPLAHRRNSQVQPYPVLKSQQKRKPYETLI